MQVQHSIRYGSVSEQPHCDRSNGHSTHLISITEKIGMTARSLLDRQSRELDAVMRVLALADPKRILERIRRGSG